MAQEKPSIENIASKGMKRTAMRGKLRAAFSKMGNYAKGLIIIPVALFTFSLSASNAYSKEPKQASEYSLQQAKMSPVEMKMAAEGIWQEILAQYPGLVESWRAGVRKASLRSGIEMPDSIQIEIVKKSWFSAIEDEGNSCKSDDYRLYINSDAKFSSQEFSKKALDMLLDYSYFKERAPFDDRVARIVLSRLASASISGRHYASAEQCAQQDACAFYFASLVGHKELAQSFASGGTSALEAAYDKKFGRGKYSLLVLSRRPFKTILEHAKAAGISEKEIISDAKKEAEAAGFKIHANLR